MDPRTGFEVKAVTMVLSIPAVPGVTHGLALKKACNKESDNREEVEDLSTVNKTTEFGARENPEEEEADGNLGESQAHNVDELGNIKDSEGLGNFPGWYSPGVSAPKIIVFHAKETQ